jgi:hypothetical protein
MARAKWYMRMTVAHTMVTGNTDDGTVGEKLLFPTAIVSKVGIAMISDMVKEGMNGTTVVSTTASSEMTNETARGTLSGLMEPTTWEILKTVSGTGTASTSFPIMEVVMREIG